MKRLAYLAVVVLAALALAPTSATVSASADDGLPQLHKIHSAVLLPNYSCETGKRLRKGYQGTALFVSRYSQEGNSPDLVFVGGCNSADYFSGFAAGDDMSLVADLGEMRLEEVSAHLAFNPKNLVAHDASFARNVPVAEGHTYALLINRSDSRGLVVFHVDDYQPNKSANVRYAVKEYQLMVARKSSDGFTWTGKNSE